MQKMKKIKINLHCDQMPSAKSPEQTAVGHKPPIHTSCSTQSIRTFRSQNTATVNLEQINLHYDQMLPAKLPEQTAVSYKLPLHLSCSSATVNLERSTCPQTLYKPHNHHSNQQKI